MNSDLNGNNNSGFNGQVLGSVNSTGPINNNPINNNPMGIETLETLDTSNVSSMASNVIGGVNNNLNNESMMQNPVNNGAVAQTVNTPEPAYTNVQNINSMPGFENPNNIGTTPPISLEPEKGPKKKNNKNNKTLFVIIIVILLFAIGFGTYYVLKYTDILASTPKVVINTKDMEVNIGESLSTDINDFASVSGTDIRNCNIDITSVDVNAVGVYKYKVTCGDIYKEGSVTVSDNRELDVTTQKVYKASGEEVVATEFIKNVNSDYTYEFVSDSEVQGYLAKGAGTYTVKIKVSNGSKELETEASLIVLEHKVKGYLTCQTKEQGLTGSSTTKVIKEKFAIIDDGNSGFGNIAEEIHEFKFTDETEYTDYLATYKTYGVVTIDSVTGSAEFDDENLTITITNELSKEDLNTKYGESNLLTYGTIRSYFKNTLGYECTYEPKKVD